MVPDLNANTESLLTDRVAIDFMNVAMLITEVLGEKQSNEPMMYAWCPPIVRRYELGDLEI